MWLHYPDQSEAWITATDQSEASITESGHRWENAFSNISESHLAPVACGGCICLINISLDRDCHLVCKYTSLSSQYITCCPQQLEDQNRTRTNSKFRVHVYKRIGFPEMIFFIFWNGLLMRTILHYSVIYNSASSGPHAICVSA